MNALLSDIRACTHCADFLPFAPKPIVAASETAKIVIIGQAPGTKVQGSGIPWDDQSGKLLRSWMGVDTATFYDPSRIAIMPMGFCYPGKGTSGDLPPRPECAPLWHAALWQKMPQVELTLLIGLYAQGYYLGEKSYPTLTENVMNYTQFGPKMVPLPHPSPRNRRWFKQHPWFDETVVPHIQQRIAHCLSS